MAHVVTGPLVIAKTAANELIYLYKDAPIPDDVPADEVQRLVDTGLVAKVDEDKPAGRKTATKD